MADIWVAREAFWYNDGDGNRFVKAGARVRDGHPLLKGRENLFREESEPEFEFKPSASQAHRPATARPQTQRR